MGLSPACRAAASATCRAQVGRWTARLVLAGLLGLAASARAQLVDDIDLRREGADAVLQVHFASPVQYLRALPARLGDQTIVFYRVLPTQQSAPPQPSDRRLDGREGEGGVTLPRMWLVDEAVVGRAADERRLLLRFAEPVRHRVRAGRGRSMIEVVFEGRGGAVAPPAPVGRVPSPPVPAATAAARSPRAAPPAPRPAPPVPEPVAMAPAASAPATTGAETATAPRYRVTLERHVGPGPATLSAPVPSALQDASLYTTRRVVDGQTVTETHLGPFASRDDADAALSLLRRRFPSAAVTEAEPPRPAPPVLAAAPAPLVTPPARPGPAAAAAVPAPVPALVPPAPRAAAVAPTAPAAPPPTASAATAAPAAPPPPAPVAPATPAVSAPLLAAVPSAASAPTLPSTARPAAPASAPEAAVVAPAVSVPAPAPTAAATPPPVPASAPLAPVAPPATVASAPASTVAPPAAAPPSAPAPAVPGNELDRQAAALLAAARAALQRGETAAAIQTLREVLDLTPNASSREAQAVIGQARLAEGDTGRARAEFEQFLRLYPQGEDADRVRAAMLALDPGAVVAAPSAAPAGPAAATAQAHVPERRRIEPTTTLTGSASLFYYGGQSKIRTQEFQDSPLSGLPELVSDATLSATDQRQWIGSADANWRYRDADVDRRFVFRDTYVRDELRPEKSRNRLTALYYDERSQAAGLNFRLGRQTPLGGGVLGRFDGAQVGYAFRPRWRAGVVAGVPTDPLLDARRHFYGASLDAEALTPQLGGSLYLIEQRIDGETDRRAVGTELRYFDGGVQGNAQLDYDLVLQALNIASLQGTWQPGGGTIVNLMYDRRATPMLALGNTLFFPDPAAGTLPRTLTDLLATTAIDVLRERARNITARSTQATLGATTPLSLHWQIGGDIRYTRTGAVPPVPDILPSGLPSSGDIWSLGLQLIGTNLYSGRDTHVLLLNALRGPTYSGQLVSYHNASTLTPALQLEPSLKWYRQSEASGLASTRWSPGLRVTYRVVQQLALESEVSVENTKSSGPTRNESSTRTFYYLGGRYEF